MTLTIRGTIVQTPDPGRLEVLENHEVEVGDDGVIESVSPARGAGADVEVVLGDREILLPGMIDTHIHAPQWPQLATGLDLPLDRWLFEETFPLEARYRDAEFARRVWAAMVPALLRSGTTTAVYYSSIHEEATTALAQACSERGQRAFVGRVAMDHPEGTPEWYRDPSAAAGIEDSARSIEEIRRVDAGAGLVKPLITPRFVPACSDELLAGLGGLAGETGERIQTHCSEGDWEHGHVLERYGITDAEALSGFGLVREHTVLAHATHLTDEDRRLLIERGAGVAHCPLSNSYFANAVFPARRSIEAGLRLGLGTDIAGGATSSMLAECGHAVTSSRMLEDGVAASGAASAGVAGSKIDIPTAFWMATAGGADLLGIPAGLLAAGRFFDAFVVDLSRPAGFEVWDEFDDWERVFEKVVRAATPGDISRVWVAGREVAGSTVGRPGR